MCSFGLATQGLGWWACVGVTTWRAWLGGNPQPTPSSPAQVRDVDQMLAIVAGGCQGEQVVDARPAGRFQGVDPEPRAGLRSGHMPGAKSVPFPQVCWLLAC